MTIAIGDMQSVGTAGWWHTSDAAGSAPSTPTLAVVNDGDGDAVTATVSGDAGVTHQLLYKQLGASAWTAGSTRSGDGDIAQAGLDNNTAYVFICVSTSGGYYSLPSAQVAVYVSDGAASVVADVAQAVADALNDGAFSMSFTAARVAVPIFDLKDLATLHVTVAPHEMDIEVLTRAQDNHEVLVDVAVQKKITSLTNTEIDSLLALVEEIADHMNRRALGTADARWRKTENKPVYSPEHLRELRQFISILTLTYRVVR